MLGVAHGQLLALAYFSAGFYWVWLSLKTQRLVAVFA